MKHIKCIGQFNEKKIFLTINGLPTYKHGMIFLLFRSFLIFYMCFIVFKIQILCYDKYMLKYFIFGTIVLFEKIWFLVIHGYFFHNSVDSFYSDYSRLQCTQFFIISSERSLYYVEHVIIMQNIVVLLWYVSCCYKFCFMTSNTYILRTEQQSIIYYIY